MIYGLREALQIVLEEGLRPGLEASTKLRCLCKGIEAMGLSMIAPIGYRLPTLNAVRIPENVDDLKARNYLLDKYGIEIGGGLETLRVRHGG